MPHKNFVAVEPLREPTELTCIVASTIHVPQARRDSKLKMLLNSWSMRYKLRSTYTGNQFSETAEQIVGFYLVETDDEGNVRTACERFTGRGEIIEFRRLAGSGNDLRTKCWIAEIINSSVVQVGWLGQA